MSLARPGWLDPTVLLAYNLPVSRVIESIRRSNNDVGGRVIEDNNVAESNPGVVRRLLALADRARADLGDVNQPGKGQRAAGWVKKPSPRLLNAN